MNRSTDNSTLNAMVDGDRLSLQSGALLVLHGAVVWANLRFSIVMSGLYVNAAIATLAFLSLSGSSTPSEAEFTA